VNGGPTADDPVRAELFMGGSLGYSLDELRRQVSTLEDKFTLQQLEHMRNETVGPISSRAHQSAGFGLTDSDKEDLIKYAKMEGHLDHTKMDLETAISIARDAIRSDGVVNHEKYKHKHFYKGGGDSGSGGQSGH
jgi:hypothetical protein